jgi:hypothetical protein
VTAALEPVSSDRAAVPTARSAADCSEALADGRDDDGREEVEVDMASDVSAPVTTSPR